MHTIHVKTDGSIVHQSQPVGSDSIVFLPFKVELEEGFTLRSYFRMLEKYPLLSKLSFFFPHYFKQCLELPPDGCVTADFGHLELGRTIEMLGFPGEPRLDIYISLRGVSDTERCELNRYRLKHLLDMPIKLGRLRHIVFGDRMDVFDFETVFTLFEFIDGIAWELSFQTGATECQLRR